MIRNLYFLIMKDVSDFRKATGDSPKRILIVDKAFTQLKENSQLNWDATKMEWDFSGIKIQSSDNINKTWIVI